MRTAILRDRDSAAQSVAITSSMEDSHRCLTCFQRIASTCLQMIENNRETAIAADPQAVHRMRIELTRLRAATLFFAPVSVDATWPGIDRQLRWLNCVLGRARNRDVTIEYADRRPYRRWAGHSHRDLRRSQDKAHRRLAKKLGSTRYGSLVLELRRWISSLPSSHGGEARRLDQLDAYCDEHLRDWRGKISTQGRHVRRLRSKSQHRLRIQSKHYRYVVEALLDQGIAVSRDDFLFCETARQVHQALGELRDLRLLRKAIGRRPPHYRKRKHTLIRRVEDLFRHRS